MVARPTGLETLEDLASTVFLNIYRERDRESMFGNHQCNTSGQLPLLPDAWSSTPVQGSDPQCGHCGYLGRPPGGLVAAHR